MSDDVLLPIIRRAILDLLNDIGGQQNDDVIARLLANLGHRFARTHVAYQLLWLSKQGLVVVENVGPFVTGEITPDGIDVSEGRLRVDGVHRHRTGR